MALYKLPFPGVSLLHMFSRQKYKAGKSFYAYSRVSILNSQVKDVNAVKAVNP
jgi:hypothetical protein